MLHAVAGDLADAAAGKCSGSTLVCPGDIDYIGLYSGTSVGTDNAPRAVMDLDGCTLQLSKAVTGFSLYNCDATIRDTDVEMTYYLGGFSGSCADLTIQGGSLQATPMNAVPQPIRPPQTPDQAPILLSESTMHLSGASIQIPEGCRIAMATVCGTLITYIANTDGSFAVRLQFAPIDNPFTDVPADAYYYDPVLWAVSQGITNGKTPTTFEPNTACTRANVVTFLWRATGCPEPTATDCPFTDVSPASYYYKAVQWAVEMGITNGKTPPLNPIPPAPEGMLSPSSTAPTIDGKFDPQPQENPS